ncbi:MAG: WD40 repeat domain-containing protein [Chloroflexi bacterium]|nr:WD40 repeat domain-containing protein [Chloroflexota bacterium]
MFKRWFWFALALTLLALPVLAHAQQPPPQAQRALDLLNQQLGTTLTLDTIDAWSWSEEMFSDASLGCPQPGRMYAQVVTRGYSFLFTHEGTTYDIRSTQDGSNIFLCSSYPAEAATPEAALPEATAALPGAESTAEAAPLTNTLPASAGPITANNAAQVEELAQLNVPTDHTAVMAWSPSGDMIAIAGSDVEGSVWLLPLNGDESRRFAAGQPVTALALARSINNLVFMATGSINGAVRFVQVEPLGLDLIEMDTTEDAQSINSIAISPDLLVVATAVGSASGGSDNAVYLWNTRTGAQLARLEHGAPVGAVAISPDGRLLATGDQLGTVRVWQLTTSATEESVEVEAEVVATYTVQTGLIRDLAFSPDSAKLAAGSMDTTAVIWTLNIGGAPMDAPAPLVLESGTDDAVLALAFSPAGSVLATAGGDPNAASADNAVRLWDTEAGNLLATLAGHTSTVGSLAFNPAGDLLASAGDDGTLRLWGVPGAG